MESHFFKKIFAPFTALRERRRRRRMQKNEEQDIENLGTKKLSAWSTSSAFKHLDRVTRWKLVDEATHQPQDQSPLEKTPDSTPQNLIKT